MGKARYLMTEIQIVQGDITQQRVDAIVNAANSSLMGGGGVDRAIHYVAGPELLMECRTLGGCETGKAKITKGYKLPARYIIHTVGSVFGHEDGSEELLLSNCYTNSLKLAEQYSLRSIAFPAISTGVFGYPKDEAAYVAIETVKYFISRHPDAFDEVIFVLFDKLNYKLYNDLLSRQKEIVNDGVG